MELIQLGYNEAKKELEYALDNQKTIEITKLKELMRKLDITLDDRRKEKIKRIENDVRNIYREINQLKETV